MALIVEYELDVPAPGCVSFKFITTGYSSKNVFNGAVNAVKLIVPVSYRSYNAASHLWEIAELKYWEQLKLVFEKVGQVRPKQRFSSTSSGKESVDVDSVHVDASVKENFYKYDAPITNAKRSKDTLLSLLMPFFQEVGYPPIQRDDVFKMEFNDLRSLYRKAAMFYHPDRVGNASKMTELNSLWTELKSLSS